MVCLFCGNKRTQVINSRQHQLTLRVWRRRRCDSCHSTFTTYEIISVQALPIVESVTPTTYSEAKLMISLYQELPDKPNRARDAHELARTVTEKLLAARPAHLTPLMISHLAYDTLSAFDKTAGLRYGLTHKLITL